MKVFLHYNEGKDTSLHKTLKITLPKSWKNGPTSKLLNQFVEYYNASEQGLKSPLDGSNLHLAKRDDSNNGNNSNGGNDKDDDNNDSLISIPSDAITIEVIDDREDVFVCHGLSKTLVHIENEKKKEAERRKAELANTVACVHFGCKNRFPKGGPYPECCYHAAPPVFHETAKFWSCCPQKKAYDWEDFQSIKGCQSGICTDKKDTSAKQFLGGCDLREAMGEKQKLKSIDDFNAVQASGSNAAPILERLRNVFAELGIENELFDQVVNGIKKNLGGDTTDDTNDDLLAITAQELGDELKKAMKHIAAQQLLIKKNE